MINGRFVLNDDWKERKEKLDVTWEDCIKRGIMEYENDNLSECLEELYGKS